MSKEKNFKMEQVIAMWRRTSKAGKPYFTGKLEDSQVVGFYNSMKQNPKEPDIRIYKVDSEGNTSKEEALSLWCNVSKAGKKYLSGKYNGKKVVGFINEKSGETKQSYFSCYYSEAEPKKAEPKTEENPFLPESEGTQEKLPF